jgi:IS5 family transposase
LSETSRLPSGLSDTSSAILLDRSSMAWSRASIRLDADTPLAWVSMICLFRRAMVAMSTLAESTRALRCWRTEVSWVLKTLFRPLKRSPIRPAAVSTCWRSGVEPGSPATALIALKKSSMPADRLAEASLITLSSWVR